MESQNHQKDPSVSTSAEKTQKVCPECNQTYIFEEKCPACSLKISEKTEALLVAARCRNIMERLTIIDLFDKPLDKLKKLNDILVDIL